MAARTLSPKQIAERERQHRFAVISLARYKAKRRVQEQLRAQGRRVSLIKPAEIATLAQAGFELNRISLMAAAEQTVNTSPLFKRYRLDANIKHFAQQPKACSDTTISVHKLGAK
jgi:hypothetical protein